MKCVILAGGKGTRISDYTKTIPKPMIKIGSKPILEHIINYYVKFGFKDFIIAGGYKFSIIKNYFKKKKKFLFGIGKSNYYKEVSIKQTTIDDYMFLNKIKEIDLLKIDAEGSEYEIVKGCFKNLKNIKIILFEHHYDDMIFKGYKFKDINDFLLQNNFKQIFKIKMPLRKTFEYIYKNKAY